MRVKPRVPIAQLGLTGFPRSRAALVRSTTAGSLMFPTACPCCSPRHRGGSLPIRATSKNKPTRFRGPRSSVIRSVQSLVRSSGVAALGVAGRFVVVRVSGAAESDATGDGTEEGEIGRMKLFRRRMAHSLRRRLVDVHCRRRKDYLDRNNRAGRFTGADGDRGLVEGRRVGGSEWRHG